MNDYKIVNDHADLVRLEQAQQMQIVAAQRAERARWIQTRKQMARQRRMVSAVFYCAGGAIGSALLLAAPSAENIGAAAVTVAVVWLINTAWRLSK